MKKALAMLLTLAMACTMLPMAFADVAEAPLAEAPLTAATADEPAAGESAPEAPLADVNEAQQTLQTQPLEAPKGEGQPVQVEGDGDTKTYATVHEAFQAITSGSATITLLGDVTDPNTPNETDASIIGSGVDITLDLNGHIYTKDGYYAKIEVAAGGKLTIKDSSEDQKGKITRTSGSLITVRGMLVMESGTVEAPGSTAVTSFSNFTMTGGTVKGFPAVNASFGTMTMGTAGDMADVPYVENLTVNTSPQINLLNGIVGRVKGKFSDTSVLNCRFETDVSDNAPYGKVAVKNGDYYVITKLTEDKVAAKIDKRYYASHQAAAAALQSGDTLTFLKDYTGSAPLKVTAYGVTIDLNGHSITNTADTGYGLELSTENAASYQDEPEVKIINGTDATSTITAYSSIHAKSWKSEYPLLFSIAENVQLTAKGGAPIDLDMDAYTLYSEARAADVHNGGFKAKHADRNDYIHGSLATAAAAKAEGETVVLLHDYNGMQPLAWPETKTTLDLGGNTYTTAAKTVLQTNENKTNAPLTIQNGTICREASAWEKTQGILVQKDNVTLTLDKVHLLADAKSDFAIVTHGEKTGIHITLKDSTIENPNGVAIYFPCADSTMDLKGTTVTGQTALAVKGGTVNIKEGTTLHGTGEKVVPVNAVESGTNSTGDALYLEGNYTDHPIEIKIEGGTFTSDHSYAVQRLFADGQEANKKITITGGTYSDTSINNFLDATHMAVPNKEGRYIVGEKTVVDKPDVDPLPDGIEATDKKAVEDAANEVKATEVTDAVNSDKLAEELKTEMPEVADNETVKIEIGVKVVVGEGTTLGGEDPKVVYDIKPVAKVIVISSGGVEGDSTEIAIPNSALNVSEDDPLTLTLPLPTGFIDESEVNNLIVKHIADDGTSQYVTPETAEAGKLVVVISHFSKFEITKKINADSLTMNHTALNATPGTPVQLTATLNPENATVNLQWTSSDKSIATVDAAGLITPHRAGTAVITATAGDQTATCTVTVTDPAVITPDTGLTLDKTSLELAPGKTAKLKASLTPADATYKYIFWASSDEAVATVSDSGVVTAVAEGTATVTAKSWYGNVAACAVTVKKAGTPTPPDEPDTPDSWPTEGLAGFVTRCYRVALSREPDKAGHADWVRWLQDGTVDAKSCTYGFVFSKEMNNKNLSDEDFVKTLYRLFMDRDGEAAGVTFWTNYLQDGHSRLEVFNGFADSVEFARIKAGYGIQ